MQLGQLPTTTREVSTNWDAAARNRLRQIWVDPDIPRADLPAIMARPMEAIARMAHRMKLGRRPADLASSGAWTDADMATLRRLWPDHARDEIAREMGRTTPAISRKAHELGLSRWPKNLPQSNTAQLQMARDKWHRMRAAQGAPVPRTPERREILMRDWPTYRPAYEIAAEMNLLPGAHMRTDNLAKWARDMGLSRPADFRPVRDPSKPKLKAKIVVEREPPPEVVARRCLHCGRGFEAAGRFLRLCQTCRGNAW